MYALKLPVTGTTIQETVNQWKRYEGIIHIEILPPTHIILIETNCNPAAITAPIPSFIEGYQVRYYQRPVLAEKGSRNGEKQTVD